MTTMTVAIAYLRTDAGRKALTVAVEEASRRGTTLQVIHVVEMLDQTMAQSHRDEVEADVLSALAEQDSAELEWELRLGTEDRDVADAIVDEAEAVGADLLVIGARRRSSAATLVFGSVSQTVQRRASMTTRIVHGED